MKDDWKIYNALELRRDGLSYRAIGEALDIDHKTARAWVLKGLAIVQEEIASSAKEIIVLDLMRLEKLFQSHWEDANGGYIPSAEIILKIMEKRHKLLGPDAPLQIQLVVEENENPSDGMCMDKLTEEQFTQLEFLVDIANSGNETNENESEVK